MPLELVLRVETRRKAAIIGVLFTMHVPSMIRSKSLTLAGVEMSLWDGRVLCMWSDDGYTQQNGYPYGVCDLGRTFTWNLVVWTPRAEQR